MGRSLSLTGAIGLFCEEVAVTLQEVEKAVGRIVELLEEYDEYDPHWDLVELLVRLRGDREAVEKEVG